MVLIEKSKIKLPQESPQPTGATGGGVSSLLRGRNPLSSPKSPKKLSGGERDCESESKSPSAKSATSSTFRLPRSRIGTETSVETALENVPGGATGSSFEEELFRQGAV